MLRSSICCLLAVSCGQTTLSPAEEELRTAESALASAASCSSFDQDAEAGTASDEVPEPQPSHSTACSTFVISCAPMPRDRGAQFIPSTCTLHFSPDTCAALGLADGTTISDPHGLKVLLQARRAPQHAWDVCVAVHEVTHGEDNQAGGWERGCTTEINAYRASAACLRDFYQRFCWDCRSPSYPGRDFCEWIAANAKRHERLLEFSVCLCAGLPNDATCKACTAACIRATNDPPACESAAKLYCD